jgi:hypothetical protein
LVILSHQGWTQIGNDPDTVEIIASGGHLYQRQSGRVLSYQGTEQGWEVIGEDPEMDQILADGDVVYERQKSGRVFMSVGNPVQGTSKFYLFIRSLDFSLFLSPAHHQ